MLEDTTYPSFFNLLAQPGSNRLGNKLFSSFMIHRPAKEMTMNAEPQKVPSAEPDKLGRIAKMVSAGIAILSVLACVILAAIRSVGLVAVTVTAIDANEEPRDHNLPLIKQKEALPDYEIAVNLTNGHKVELGAKPNMSAANGLNWKLNDPVSVSEIAGIRLLDQDKLVSDEIVEVQLTEDSIVEGNYRFEFETARSFSVGVGSFFKTPIGKAIIGAFVVAVITLILTGFRTGGSGIAEAKILQEVAGISE